MMSSISSTVSAELTVPIRSVTELQSLCRQRFRADPQALLASRCHLVCARG